jgi:large subunit ribosomal protein L21
LQKLADAIYRVYLTAGYLYGNYKDKFMSYAIIETGGKQVRVEPGRFYDIELLPVEPEASIIIESVLLVQHDGEVTMVNLSLKGQLSKVR